MKKFYQVFLLKVKVWFLLCSNCRRNHRYIDKKSVVRYLKNDTSTKRCIGMINQSNLKAKLLADTILSHLKSQNLLLVKMIGQGYDGASSMSGKEKGVQAIVKESSPLAVYTHCSAHVVNLILVKSYVIPEIHSMFVLTGDILLNQAVKEMLDSQMQSKA